VYPVGCGAHVGIGDGHSGRVQRIIFRKGLWEREREREGGRKEETEGGESAT